MVLIREKSLSVYGNVVVESWHHFSEVVKTIFLEHLKNEFKPVSKQSSHKSIEHVKQRNTW